MTTTQTQATSKKTNFPPEFAAAERFEKRGPLMLDLASIDPPAEPLRETIDEAELQSLADSLASVSLLAPITVTPINEPGEARFEVVSGDRRYRAAKLAGWRKISAYTVTAPREVLLEISVTENLQRKNLTVLEQAAAFELLTRKKRDGGAGLHCGQAAKLTGFVRHHIARMVQICSLPSQWKAKARAGELGTGKLFALTPLLDQPAVLAAALADYEANPADWDSVAGFREQLAVVVRRVGRLCTPLERMSEDAWVTNSDIRDRLPQLSKHQVSGRLKKRRLTNPACFRQIEDDERRGGEPLFEYRWGDVKEIFPEFSDQPAQPDATAVPSAAHLRRSAPVDHDLPQAAASDGPLVAPLPASEILGSSDAPADPVAEIEALLRHVTTLAQIERIERAVQEREARIRRGDADE